MHPDKPLIVGIGGSTRPGSMTSQLLDACLDDYRFALLQGPLITVLGAAYSQRTDRGDDMFMAMAARSCAAVRDHRTLDLVG